MSKWIVKSEDGQWYLERRPLRDVITSRQKEATRFASKEEAIEAAGKEGRAIRLVGYAEQLRRLREAQYFGRETSLGMSAWITQRLRDRYRDGRRDERAAVVGWLRTATPETPRVHEALCIAADGVDGGEHVKEHKR